MIGRVAASGSLPVLFIASASLALACHRPTHAQADTAPATSAATSTQSASVPIAPAGTSSADTSTAVASARPAATHSAAPSGGAQFNGTYKCWNGLRLTQHGNQVSGETATDLKHPLSSDNSEFTCAVTGDRCIGTATEMFHDGKGGKKPNGRPRALTLAKQGSDIRWEEASVTKTCPSH
jgi:hypothetical protein